MDKIQTKAQQFLNKLKPKLREATINLRAKLDEMLRRTPGNHIIKEDSNMRRRRHAMLGNLFAKKTPPCSAINDLIEKGDKTFLQKPDVVQYMPEVGVAKESQPNKENCANCGSLKHKDLPCNNCGDKPKNNTPSQCSQQPQYLEFVHGQQVPYSPTPNNRDQSGSPRTVFDRLGQRYHAYNNGNLRILPPSSEQIDVDVAAQPPSQYYNRLENILNKNQQFIDQSNPGNDPDHLIPEIGDFAVDTIDFIKDLADDNSARQNLGQTNYGHIATYDSDAFDTMGSVKGLVQNVNRRVRQDSGANKKSYEIIPLLQDTKDGSVLVKIAPAKRAAHLAHARQRQYAKNGNDAGIVDGTIEFVEDEKNEVETYRKNDEKHLSDVSNKGDYEVITIDQDEVDRKNLSKDDLELLRYIYGMDENYKRTDGGVGGKEVIKEDSLAKVDEPKSIEFNSKTVDTTDINNTGVHGDTHSPPYEIVSTL